MTTHMEQITASAGSGKTYTLTRRFLRHLATALPDGGPSLCAIEGTHAAQHAPARHSLGGILAATFTNKAATEMQARVVRELKQQALAHGDGDKDFPLTPEQARHWVQTILRRFDAVNIRTIDSLLTLLVRLNALPLALPPDFTPLFSLDEALLPLYDALLDQAAGEPGGRVETLFREACRSLLFHHRAKGVAAGDMLREKLGELVDLHLSGAALPDAEHAKAAAARFAACHNRLTETATDLEKLFDAENLKVNAHARGFLAKCRACSPMTVPDFKSTYADKESVDEWMNRASRGMASTDVAAAFKDFTAAWRAMTEEGPALAATREYMPLIALARPLIAGIDAMQSLEGAVPAARLPALALEALAGESGVADSFCRMGDALVHLLFDEFQDTSTDQWRAITPLVVECLSRGGSLTYVGDVKQAIYGWRGGNAELFDAVARDAELTAMLEAGPEHTTLPYNWRSAPAIVAVNNRVFGPLADPAVARRVLEAMLPAATDPEVFADAVRVLAAAFARCEQRVPEKNAANDGYVRLAHIEAPATPDLMDAVRDALEDLMHNELLPRRNPGEIAVLVRKNREAELVAQWLAEWGVPVVTEHSFCLGNHPLVTRLANTLTFLEYPLDDAAFWSAVSGPELLSAFGGPDRAALAGWLAATRGQPGSGPLFLAFRKAFPEAWRSFLGPFHDQAGLLSAYDTVCELIRHCRLFERFPEHAPFLRRFAEVTHAAETEGFSSLSAFLDFWQDKGKEERVPMPEHMNAVRILSMHKAKGLEFPVVIVPFHHQTDPTTRPLVVEEKNGLPLIAYRAASSAEAVRGVLEQINLLYVAWTRPAEELYAFITRSGHSARHSAMGKALEALVENLPFTDGVFAYGAVPEKSAEHTTLHPQPPKVFPGTGHGAGARADQSEDGSDAPLMAWLPRLKIFRTPQDGKGFTERQRGLLAHACLEALTLGGNPAEDAARAVERGLRAFPVPMPDPEGVRRDMEAMIAWYASLPDTARWMRHGSPEQPLMDADGDLHRVDLLVDAPASPLLAVEYKTGLPSPDHIAQVAGYLALLGPAARRREPGRAIAGVLVYLDRREIVPVPENIHG